MVEFWRPILILPHGLLERVEEAKSAGAEALVTACPWCERVFKDTILETGGRMKVYDIMEIVQQAI